MTKKGNFSVEVYKSWCKRCGICSAFCPKEVLAQDDSGVPYVKDPESCIGCLWCELRCPDFAIRVRSLKKKEGKEEEPQDGREEDAEEA